MGNAAEKRSSIQPFALTAFLTPWQIHWHEPQLPSKFPHPGIAATSGNMSQEDRETASQGKHADGWTGQRPCPPAPWPPHCPGVQAPGGGLSFQPNKSRISPHRLDLFTCALGHMARVPLKREAQALNIVGSCCPLFPATAHSLTCLY